MKHTLLIITICSAFFYTCSAGKDANKTNTTPTTTNSVEQTNTEEPNPDKNIMQEALIMAEGHVRDRSREGCGFLIEVFVNDDSTLVEPLKLPEIHKVDGKHVKLTYRMSKRSSTCTLAAPIIIDKIIG